jgi:hypothetical protein
MKHTETGNRKEGIDETDNDNWGTKEMARAGTRALSRSCLIYALGRRSYMIPSPLTDVYRGSSWQVEQDERKPFERWRVSGQR